MRIWSLHPSVLDRQGLARYWTEGWLAFRVLLGQTKGYRNHPQLDRWRRFPNPPAALAAYLAPVLAEAHGRGYAVDGKYDPSVLTISPDKTVRLEVTEGQLAFEWRWLREKLRRSPTTWAEMPAKPIPHPMVDLVPGSVEPWERSSL